MTEVRPNAMAAAPAAPDRLEGGEGDDRLVPPQNFLQMLEANPYGWGNLPPEPPAPVWERQPELFHGEIRNPQERPQDYMTPVAETIGPPVIPGIGLVGRTMRNALMFSPRLTAGVAGIIGLAGAPVEAGERANLTRRQQRELEIKRQEQQMRLEAQREQQRMQAEAAERARQAEAEAKIKEQQMQADFEREQAARARNAPFRERHPAVAEALPWIAAVMAPVMAGGLKGISNRAGSGIAARWQEAIEAAENARPGSLAERRALSTVQSFLDDYNAYQANALTTLGAGARDAAIIGGAAALPVEARMLPTQIDAATLPYGVEAGDKARERIYDPEFYKQSIEQSLMMGVPGAFIGYELGSRVPRPYMPAAESTGLLNPTPPRNALKAITAGRQPAPPPHHSATQPRDERGRFTRREE